MGDRYLYMWNIMQAANIASFISPKSKVYESEARAGYTVCLVFHISRERQECGRFPGFEAVKVTGLRSAMILMLPNWLIIRVIAGWRIKCLTLKIPSIIKGKGPAKVLLLEALKQHCGNSPACVPNTCSLHIHEI